MAPALLFQVTPFPHGPGRSGRGGSGAPRHRRPRHFRVPSGPAAAGPGRRLRLAGRGNAAPSLASGRSAVWVSISSACSVRALHHCFRREREGGRNSQCAKALPTVPGRRGKGAKTSAGGSGAGQGFPADVYSSLLSVPVWPSPSGPAGGTGLPAGGSAVGGRGRHVRLWGGSSALPSAGSGRSLGRPRSGPGSRACATLWNGPAAGPCPAPGQSCSSPRTRCRAASGEREPCWEGGTGTALVRRA